MNSFVDTSVFCGYWPFRNLAARTPQALKEHLRSYGVKQAWVAAAEAILLPDPMEANESLLTAVAGDPFFLPVVIVDVTLATWHRDTERCLQEWGGRAVKITPNYHQYTLADSRVTELADLVRDFSVPLCVQVRMMDERTHHPLMRVSGVPAAEMAELAVRHPKARFLACGAYQGELKTLREAGNIWVELSHVESGQELARAISVIGWERLVFGSHSPFLYFAAVAGKLDVDQADVIPEHVAAIRAENAGRLMGATR